MKGFNYIIEDKDGTPIDAFQGFEVKAMNKATELDGFYKTVNNETYKEIKRRLSN